MKILVLGDIHAKIPSYTNILKQFINKHGEDVYSVQLGDFGLAQDYERRNFHFDRSELLDRDRHVFFGGNHDDYNNLPDFHLGDFGLVPFWDNAFFVRGARSIDKNLRTPNVDWWKEEELSWKQSNEALDLYNQEKPDVMLTHDAPDTAIHALFKHKDRHKTHTGALLDQMIDQHAPKIWFFGHWHRNKIQKVGETIFICLDELGTFLFDTEKDIDMNIYSHKKGFVKFNK